MHPSTEADDLSGLGAKITGGRWNEKNVPMVYTSETRSMACLETIVHLNAGGLPFYRYLVAIDIPDVVWAAARRETAPGLKVGWDAAPAGRVSIRFGTEWLYAKTSAILVVPSVVLPEEFNVLINPMHADSGRLKATKVRRWTYDPRLSKAV